MKSSPRKQAKTELQVTLTGTKRSGLFKYRMLVLGSRSWWSLIKYEVIMMICSLFPGALGFAFRKVLYPMLFAKVGKGTVFGQNMTIRHPHKIRIGERCVLDDLVVLDAKGDDNRGITIGNDVIIARNTVISCKGGDIEIGDNSNISLNSMIHSEKSVTIGARNLWAAYCYIIGSGRHGFERTDMPIIQQGTISDGIVMEDDIWLGADVKIMDGCHIGKGAVIGAGSLVNRDIPSYGIAVGSPARIIRRRGESAERPGPAAESKA